MSIQHMQETMENNMKAMFAKFAAQFQTTPVVPAVGAAPQGKPSQASAVGAAPQGKQPSMESEQDPYILDLQDTGGYDSDGKSIHGDGRRPSHITYDFTYA
jgi:hypothetical protein